VISKSTAKNDETYKFEKYDKQGDFSKEFVANRLIRLEITTVIFIFMKYCGFKLMVVSYNPCTSLIKKRTFKL